MPSSNENDEANRLFRKFMAVVAFVAIGAAAGTLLLTLFAAAADPQWSIGPEAASWLMLTYLFYALFATAFGLPGFWLSLLVIKRLLIPAWMRDLLAGSAAGVLATLILIGPLALRSDDIPVVVWIGALNLIAGAFAGLSFWLIAHRPGRSISGS
jgi:hypothetical protein